MCKVCTEAVHSVALWTRTLSRTCVKYVPYLFLFLRVPKWAFLRVSKWDPYHSAATFQKLTAPCYSMLLLETWLPHWYRTARPIAHEIAVSCTHHTRNKTLFCLFFLGRDGCSAFWRHCRQYIHLDSSWSLARYWATTMPVTVVFFPQRHREPIGVQEWYQDVWKEYK